MIRYFLLLFGIFLCNEAHAQNSSEDVLVGERVWRVPKLPTEAKQIVYSGQVSLRGMSKEQLFNKAYYWLKHNLKSDDIAMRVHDKRTGQIAGKGKIMYNQSVMANNAAQGIYFDYDIRIEDGAYSYRLENFSGIVTGKPVDYSEMYFEELNKGNNNGLWTHKYRYEMLSDLNSFLTLFLQGLKAEMAR